MVTALGDASHSHMRESKHALVVWDLHLVLTMVVLSVCHTSAALFGGKILLDAVTSTFI